MKGIKFVVITFFSAVFLAAMPMIAAADAGQPGKQGMQQDRGGQPGQEMKDPGEDIGKGAGAADITLTKGILSGEVVNINKQSGLIEIKTEEGIVNSFRVEEQAKQQLDKLEKGDQVNLVMSLRAEEVTPQTTPSGQQGMQQQEGQRPMTR